MLSIKVAFVLLAVGLQKRGPKSKAKDHQDTLAKQLVLWREREIRKLLHEFRIIQGQIGKQKGSASLDKTKVLQSLCLRAKLMQHYGL